MDVHYSSKNNDWSTPQDFFDTLNKEFNFTLDPCATPETAKCKKFFTESEDGLSKDWGGNIVFCNPPYGTKIAAWVEKAYKESKKPHTLIVLLLPSRTDTRYFHKYVYHKCRMRFLKGRLKFGGSKTSAPFPSMLAIYSRNK